MGGHRARPSSTELRAIVDGLQVEGLGQRVTPVAPPGPRPRMSGSVQSRAGTRIPPRSVSDAAAWRDVPAYRSEAAAVCVSAVHGSLTAGAVREQSTGRGGDESSRAALITVIRAAPGLTTRAVAVRGLVGGR